MNAELIAYLVAQALEAALKIAAEFEATHGRQPTLEDWKALEAKWRSPAEIEAAARAAARPTAATPSGGI